MGNRIIKFEYGFSAKDKTIKKVYHLHEIPNIQNICDVWNDLPIKYVRQFTGLHDKNGKEIYEGDIVDLIDHPTGVESCKGKVYYDKGAYRVAWSMILLGDACPKWCEIIGNIYENPELLTTK